MDPVLARLADKMRANADPYRDPQTGQFTSGPGGGGPGKSSGGSFTYGDRQDLARLKRAATSSSAGETGSRIGRAIGLILAAGGALALGIAHPKAVGAVAIKKLGTAQGIGQLAITGLAGAQIGEILGASLGDAGHAVKGLFHKSPQVNSDAGPIMALLPAVRALLAQDEQGVTDALDHFQRCYGNDLTVAHKLNAAIQELNGPLDQH